MLKPCSTILSFVFLLSTFYYVKFASAVRLLLLDDSISRHFSDGWCEVKTTEYKFVHTISPDFAWNFTATPHSILTGRVILWGDSKLYHQTNLSPCYCRDQSNGDLVALVQIYGSNDTGPYYNMKVVDIESQRLNKTYDTKPRMELAVNEYMRFTNGLLPDRVIFHSVTWDAVRWLDNKYGLYDKNSDGSNRPEWQTLLDNFEYYTNKRIDHLYQLFNQSAAVDIGLRTATQFDLGGHMVRQFNNIVRQIAHHRNMTLYDFDNDYWSKHHFDYSKQNSKYFWDWVHPKYHRNYHAANILLGRQYSSFYSYKGIKPPVAVKSLSGYENVTFILIRAHSNSNNNSVTLPGTGEVFYCTMDNNRREKWHIGNPPTHELFTRETMSNNTAWNNSNTSHELHRHRMSQYFTSLAYETYISTALDALLLGASDMMQLPEHVIESIPTAGVMPVLFSNTRNIGFTSWNSSSNSYDLFISFHQSAGITRISAEFLFDAYDCEVVRSVHRRWFDYVPVESFWFVENALVRYHTDKAIYVLRNNTKFGFSSGHAFMSMGFDFDQVITLGPEHKKAFDAIQSKGNIA